MKGPYTEEYHEKRMAAMGRDDFRCTWPSCKRRGKLQTHHIVAREEGGSDEPGNLITMCPTHHVRLHRWLRKVKRIQRAGGER